MNMIMMVGLMVLIFFTSLVVMSHYRYRMPPKIWNIAFIVADLVVYFCWNLAGYERGWLDKGWMTLENISPMVCTVVPFTLIMNDKVKQAAYDMLAFFSFGLFTALMISPEHAYLFNYNIEANFVYTSEAACHLVVGLFGIYLVLSGQVKPSFRSWKRAIICTYSIIGFGVFLNYVFHKQYWGMNPYGSSKIYMIDLFGSHEATLAAYLAGVLIVLTVGMQSMYLLDKLTADAPRQDAEVRIGRRGATVSVPDAADGQCEAGVCVEAKPAAYIFDLDGTLIDSMPTFARLIISTLDGMGIAYPDDVVRITTPLGYRGAAEYFTTLGMTRDVDGVVDEMTERARHEYENSIPLKAGVMDTLLALRAGGASLNVLTASPHAMLDPCLKRNGVYDLFDNLWSSDDFPVPKSNPEIYRMAAERLGREMSEIVFVDDNVGAVGAAMRSGVSVIGIFDESSAMDREAITEIADGYAESFSDIPLIAEKIKRESGAV